MPLKIKFAIIALLLSSLFFDLPVSAQEPSPTPDVVNPTGQGSLDLNKPSFVPGEILVKFKDGVSSQRTRRGLSKVQGQIKQTVSAINVARVEVSKGQELAAIAALRTDPNVEFVEPNYIARALDTPNDPSFGIQWGYIKAQFPTAWDVTKGDSSLIVAVIDTGIDLDHPDLDCTVSNGASKLTAGFDFVNDDNAPDDDDGHGTHVAGTVGACTDNSLGVAGAAPNVRLMPVKVLDENGDGNYLDVASGIVYATDNGAKIINLSLGGRGTDDTLASAVAYAHNKGVLLVAASGNSDTALFYPSAYSQVIAVGSTDSGDNRLSSSNHGAGLDVVAPGGFIYSTIPGGYTSSSGTSMASPHVAGLAALIWSVDPSLTSTQVRQLIRDTADDLGSSGFDIFYGYGRINAWQALESYATVKVQYVNGGEIDDSITFFVDDVSTTSSNTIRVSRPSSETITWNAALSPDESWVSISPSGSGLSAAVAYGDYTINVTQPATYGTYTTDLVFTGESASGTQVGPETVTIKLVYTSQIKTFFFPIIIN